MRLFIMRYEHDINPTNGAFKKSSEFDNSYADILEFDADINQDSLYIVFSGGEGMTQYYDGMEIHGLADTFLNATKLLDTRQGFVPRGDPHHLEYASYEMWRYMTESAALHLYILKCAANSFIVV